LVLPQQYQASLLEALAAAAARFPQRALLRKGPGPGPLVQLRRAALPPPALAPRRLGGKLGGPGGASMRRSGGNGNAGHGPFIFNPYAEKRERGTAVAAAEAAPVEWVSAGGGAPRTPPRTPGPNGGSRCLCDARWPQSPFIPFKSPAAYSPKAVFAPTATALPALDSRPPHMPPPPRQVTGDECRAEVVLVNPFLLPLRLEGLSLAVEAAAPEPSGAPATAAAGAAAAAREGAGDGAGPKQQQRQEQQEQQPPRPPPQGEGADAAGEVPVVLSPVSVTLPAGGKPVRVSLAVTPTRPGDLLLKGVTATAWGVTWNQPLTLLPRLAPLSAPGALRPQPPQRVRVLPRLPQLRATLTGPDLSITAPQEPSEAGGSGGGGLPVGRGGGAGRGGGGGGGGQGGMPAAAPKGGRGGGSGLAKAPSVPVFEGQVLSWSLGLSNTSELDVGPIGVEVVNSRGAPLRPPAGGAQLPASFVGVHVDTSGADAALKAASGAPLAPRRSVALPLALVVGRPPADSFEEVVLEVGWGGVGRGGAGC
jgi:hypothetical protein